MPDNFIQFKSHLRLEEIRWQIFWRGSVINRFLAEVKDATVQVVPLTETREIK